MISAFVPAALDHEWNVAKLHELDGKRLIDTVNWFGDATVLHALTTDTNGDCALLALIGSMKDVGDLSNGLPEPQELRTLMSKVLKNDPRYRERWQAVEQVKFSRSGEQSELEWTALLHEAESQGKYLCGFHLFALANILKRPILVVGPDMVYGSDGKPVQKCDVLGIYLPLLCGHEDCRREPLVIGFWKTHFVTLTAASRTDADDFIPIDSCPGELMPVQFCLNGNDPEAQVSQFLDTCDKKSPDGTTTVRCVLLRRRRARASFWEVSQPGSAALDPAILAQTPVEVQALIRQQTEKIRQLEAEKAERAGGPMRAAPASGPAVSVGAPELRVDPGGEDKFSSVEVDRTLTRFDNEDIAVVQWLYRQLQLVNGKGQHMQGDPKFAVRHLNFQEAEQNIENVVVGKCQSGKSGEAVFMAWCSFFVLGCLPVLLVRNSGGLKQGTDDMREAIRGLNEEIVRLLTQKGLSKEDHIKFQLDNIWTDEAMVPERRQHFGSTGAVLIVLNNPTHLRRIAAEILPRGATFRPATLEQRAHDGASWIVKFEEAPGRTHQSLETVRVSDLRKSNGGKFGLGAVLSVGMSVRAKASRSLRPSVGACMLQYGEKSGRSRIVFVCDEADMIIGSPSRRGNKSEQWHFVNHIAEATRVARGIREYIFGTVSITATPGALFLCTLETNMCPWCQTMFAAGEQSVEVRHLFRTHADGTQQTGVCHYAHKSCIERRLALCETHGTELACVKCATQGGGIECCSAASRRKRPRQHDETDSDDAASSDSSAVPSGSDGQSSSSEDSQAAAAVINRDDLTEVQQSAHCRKLKPNVTEIEVPSNYVRYTLSWEEEREAADHDDRMKIRRMVLSERSMKNNKTEQYRRYFVDSEQLFSDADWDDMMKACKRDKQDKEIVAGFSMRYNSKTGTVAVHKTKNGKNATQEMLEISRAVKELEDSTRMSMQTTDMPSAARSDGEGLKEMITSMMTSPDEWRTGLILSDNTKNTAQQSMLATYLVKLFDNIDPGLAVVTWNNRSITVLFTSKAVELSAETDLVGAVRANLARHFSSVSDYRPENSKSIKGLVVDKDVKIRPVLEALKRQCSRVLIITGEIGGRGVPYHDLRHERLLTDMFMGQNVSDDGREITAHGEIVIQGLGRLNTICCLEHPPEIRLWASKNLHEWHMHQLNEVDRMVKAVQKAGNYSDAMRLLPKWIAGRKSCGTPAFAHVTRHSFRRSELKMRGSKEMTVALTGKRRRQEPRPKYLPLQSELLPPSGMLHLPPLDGPPESFIWRPAAASGPWSEAEHAKWWLEVRPTHIEAARGKFERFTAEAQREGRGIVDFQEREGEERIFRVSFKSIEQLHAFIEEGGAGPKEQQLLRLFKSEEQLFHGEDDD